MDTRNVYWVGSLGDSVAVLRPPGVTERLSKAEALVFAAYLVSMSKASREEFETALTAVEAA